MPKLSKNFTAADNAEAARMSRIRAKLKAKKGITQTERALLDAYERKLAAKGRRKPAGDAPPQAAQAPQPAQPTESAPPPVGDTVGAPTGVAPEVHTTLPGMGSGGEFVPPPLSVGGVGPSTRPSGGTQPPSATTAAPSASGSAPTPPKPAMTREEAEASADMVSGLVVTVFKEFNEFNLAHGASGFAKESDYWAILQFSIKRLTLKYASVIDEDTYDGCVIAGSAGFIGYNSYKVYIVEKAKGGQPEPIKNERAPVASAPANGVTQPPAPQPRPSLQRGPVIPFNPDGAF